MDELPPLEPNPVPRYDDDIVSRLEKGYPVSVVEFVQPDQTFKDLVELITSLVPRDIVQSIWYCLERGEIVRYRLDFISCNWPIALHRELAEDAFIQILPDALGTIEGMRKANDADYRWFNGHFATSMTEAVRPKYTEQEIGNRITELLIAFTDDLTVSNVGIRRRTINRIVKDLFNKYLDEKEEQLGLR
jgi:hypothetical protein